MNATKRGWVACDYTEGDRLDQVRHSEIYDTYEQASAESGYEGVRWVGDDGYLYVDRTNVEA